MFNNNSNSEKINLQESKKPRGGVNRSAEFGAPLSTAHKGPFCEYVAGASLLKTSKGRDMLAVGGGIRGKVQGFSRSSRLRMLRLIACVLRDAELPCFVTLTYPDKFPTVERAKRDLDVFIRRIRRAFLAGLIWKLEPQKRGAPHYHLLVWGVDQDELFIWVVKNWYEIAGDGDINHKLFHQGKLPDSEPCVSKVDSFNGVWFYAAKYIGKVFEVAEWGKQWTGRFWGVVNPKNIPFGEKIAVEADFYHVVKVMRYQRRFAHLKYVKTMSNSVTTFCDVDQWIKKVL